MSDLMDVPETQGQSAERVVTHQAESRALPVVAIVGRPNVGKSSLFNALLRKRIAVVHDTPGVTRDRNYEVCDWTGREFYLVDTGGMAPGSELGFDRQITEQASVAVSEADVIVFVVDAQVPPDVSDERIARLLQRSAKP
ncbi:MAG TPA: GTPase, partial [candidate division Zixibacteria bacterium]|nr:GTPase [candidate division Zixibacteria bacterium]